MPISLNPDEFKQKLTTQNLGKEFYFFKKLTSTFDATDNLNVCHGSVIYSASQTRGKGRLGREWVSGRGGIYFSLILSPDTEPENMQFLTCVCALGVQRALAHFVDCHIKWPNDIVSKDGKKLCGILTKIRFLGNVAQHINVGIGINANNHIFDSSLIYATSLRAICGREVNENDILCRVLLEIETCLKMPKTDVIEEFSKVCITLGSRVEAIYSSCGNTVRGTCIKIESDGSITIQKDDTELINVNSGEVSVRGIYGETYV